MLVNVTTNGEYQTEKMLVKKAIEKIILLTMIHCLKANNINYKNNKFKGSKVHELPQSWLVKLGIT